MDVKFASLIANASDFPEATVKANPCFSFFDPVTTFRTHQLGSVTFTKNGRGAIGIAARHLKDRTKKNVVLVPAYHCPALVEPFVWLDYEIRFYPVNQDLSVDTQQLASMLTKDVTHCVVVRFFGFNQNVDEIITLLNQQNKFVIEDCAHSLVDFMEQLNKEEQRVSARVCSINKLLPTIDGGLLYLKGQQQVSVKYCRWVDELKGVLYLLGLTQLIQRVMPKKADMSDEQIQEMALPKDDAGLRYFSPEDLAIASFRHTKLILQQTDLEEVKKRRQDNFNYLYKHLKDAKAGKPLYYTAETSVPYVFPFLLDDATGFNKLRHKQIQVLRWEEVAESDCDVSGSYRTRLIQLPCHHQLTRQQLDHIIESVKALEKE